jgi:quercetin dioxygenase-like cupin family protein
MSQPKTDLKIVDNVFVKLHHFANKGDTHDGHAHSFDHITLLSSGAVKMVHDNGENFYTAPHLIVTPKGIKHQFTALVPNTVFCCIHAIREKDDIDGVASPNITLEQAWELMGTVPLTKE